MSSITLHFKLLSGDTFCITHTFYSYSVTVAVVARHLGVSSHAIVLFDEEEMKRDPEEKTPETIFKPQNGDWFHVLVDIPSVTLDVEFVHMWTTRDHVVLMEYRILITDEDQTQRTIHYLVEEDIVEHPVIYRDWEYDIAGDDILLDGRHVLLQGRNDPYPVEYVFDDLFEAYPSRYRRYLLEKLCDRILEFFVDVE